MMRIQLLAFAGLVLAFPLGAQELRFRPIVDLRTGTDSLTIDDSQAVPTVTGGPDRGWFVAGLMLRHKWAEFDSNGRLVRAPGRRGDGPGEFRQIDYVFPMAGDTVLVVEGQRLTRALRNGRYLGREALDFSVRHYTRYRGALWISGRSAWGLYVAALDPSGKTVMQVQVPSDGQGQFSGQVVSWNEALWLWQYPRGPLHRIDPASGVTRERWYPLGQDERARWRANVSTGPDGTLLLDYYDPTRGDSRREWVIVGPSREVVHRQWQTERMQGGHFFKTKAWGPLFDTTPVKVLAGIRIFELSLAPTR